MQLVSRKRFFKGFCGTVDGIGVKRTVLAAKQHNTIAGRNLVSNAVHRTNNNSVRGTLHPPKQTGELICFHIQRRYTVSNTEKKNVSWIDSPSIPQRFRPYLHLARADKPVGSMLLMWPCFWSTCLAAPMNSLPDPSLLITFVIGSFIMRGAGCTINDMWDKDFDVKVERTKTRPLASKEISMKQAAGFLTVQLAGGLCVLLTLNYESIILGFLSMPLVIVYPLMKRYTNWPQLVLGLTFNWGALIGWSAVTGSVSLYNTLPLYAAGVCWTLVYDTLYGYQDTKDDSLLGLKSTALHLGPHPQWPLTIIGTGGMLGGLLLTGYVNDLSMAYYAGTAAMWSHIMWQIWSADISNTKNLWNRFDSNKYAGGIITGAIILGHYGI